MRALRIAATSIAAIAVFCTSFSWPIQLGLLLVVVGVATWMLRERQPERLQFDGLWRSWRGGEEALLQLDSTVVWPLLIVLRFRRSSSRGTTTLILLPDSLSRDDWRRLRMYLQQVDVFAADQRAM